MGVDGLSYSCFQSVKIDGGIQFKCKRQVSCGITRNDIAEVHHHAGERILVLIRMYLHALCHTQKSIKLLNSVVCEKIVVADYLAKLSLNLLHKLYACHGIHTGREKVCGYAYTVVVDKAGDDLKEFLLILILRLNDDILSVFS